jgi:hypothetical protein
MIGNGEHPDFSDRKVVEFKSTVLICLRAHTGSSYRMRAPDPALQPEPLEGPSFGLRRRKPTIADLAGHLSLSQCKPDGEDKRDTEEK